MSIEKVPSRTGDVEIVWQIPAEPVDGFVISYRFDNGAPGKEIRVSPGELGKYEDDKVGFVYRYLLHDIPSNRGILVSIAAFRGGEVSKPSQIVKVEPEGSGTF